MAVLLKDVCERYGVSRADEDAIGRALSAFSRDAEVPRGRCLKANLALDATLERMEEEFKAIVTNSAPTAHPPPPPFSTPLHTFHQAALLLRRHRLGVCLCHTATLQRRC